MVSAFSIIDYDYTLHESVTFAFRIFAENRTINAAMSVLMVRCPVTLSHLIEFLQKTEGALCASRNCYLCVVVHYIFIYIYIYRYIEIHLRVSQNV